MYSRRLLSCEATGAVDPIFPPARVSLKLVLPLVREHGNVRHRAREVDEAHEAADDRRNGAEDHHFRVHVVSRRARPPACLLMSERSLEILGAIVSSPSVLRSRGRVKACALASLPLAGGV